MSDEELEYGTDIIINAINFSSLKNYTKLELLINMKKFLSNYKENIIILNNLEKSKKYEK